MQTGYWQSLPALIQNGADLTGLFLLTALLTLSAWTCLRPQPVLRHRSPSAGQQHGFYLLLCALAPPLLMFASLACGLALLQKAQPLLAASALWKPYRTLTWLLYGLVGLQQLFALQRIAYGSAPRKGGMPLAASTLLLPLAMALGLLALERACLPQANMPHLYMAATALATISGIALWLPVQLLRSGTLRTPRAEPTLASTQELEELVQDDEPGRPAQALPTALSAAQEIELRLGEISLLLEQEKTEAEQASQHELLEQHEVRQASTIQQQVNEQKFLFESGLPCNLGLLVNGLIILDQPLDLRDHVRGDSLLHAALRNANRSLAQQLIEHGVDIGAANWAGVSARACTQDPDMLALLDTVAGHGDRAGDAITAPGGPVNTQEAPLGIPQRDQP